MELKKNHFGKDELRERNIMIDLKTSYKIIFPGSSAGKEFTCNAEDPGSIPGSRRSPGEGHSNPLQYSCLGSPMDRGAWQATVHGVTKSRT